MPGGGKPLSNRPMTGAERAARYNEKKRKLEGRALRERRVRPDVLPAKCWCKASVGPVEPKLLKAGDTWTCGPLCEKVRDKHMTRQDTTR